MPGKRRRRRVTAAGLQRRKDYNGSAHRQARKAGQALVDAGRGVCWRCGGQIPTGSTQLWHVGHDDNDRTIIRGVEDRHCNLGAAARKRNRMARAARQAATLPPAPQQKRTTLVW